MTRLLVGGVGFMVLSVALTFAARRGRSLDAKAAALFMGVACSVVSIVLLSLYIVLEVTR